MTMQGTSSGGGLFLTAQVIAGVRVPASSHGARRAGVQPVSDTLSARDYGPQPARHSPQPTGLPKMRYRFGVFEADSTTGELRRQGLRIKLHSQPLQLLFLLLERPGELLTREEISKELWPDGTFVDYEHGVNSAVNRIREALGDKANHPRFIETLARRGYRFVAQVERIPLREEAATADSKTEILADELGGEPAAVPS